MCAYNIYKESETSMSNGELRIIVTNRNCCLVAKHFLRAARGMNSLHRHVLPSFLIFFIWLSHKYFVPLQPHSVRSADIEESVSFVLTKKSPLLLTEGRAAIRSCCAYTSTPIGGWCCISGTAWGGLFVSVMAFGDAFGQQTVVPTPFYMPICQ